MSRQLPNSWPDAFLQIMEMWFDEPGREEEKKKFIANELFEKRSSDLALKESVCEKQPEKYPETVSEVLIAKEILAEFGTISPHLLMRKIKCSHSRAYEIYQELMGVS